MPINPIASKHIKEKVISNSWDYIHENFHKFNESNKIKIVLAIITKNMPTVIEGEVTNVVKMPMIEKDSKPLEHNIGK